MTDDWGRRDPAWAGIRTVTVRVAGRPVRTLQAPAGAGPGGSNAGRTPPTPHLLLHGLGGSATNWLDVLAGLGGGPAVAVDLPGFGRTEPPPGGPRLGAQAWFVPALCRALGLDRVVLHGSSMGGLIALLVAAEHPELVAGLVLCSPALPVPIHRLGAVGPRTLLRLLPFSAPGIGTLGTRAAWSALSAEQLYARALGFVYAHPERLRASLRGVALEDYRTGRRLDWRPRAFATAARSLVLHLLGGRRARAAVRTVLAPTLVLRGAEDPLVPAVVVEAAAAARPDWTVRRLPATGHVAALESPAAYLEAVRTWAPDGPGWPTPGSAGPADPAGRG